MKALRPKQADWGKAFKIVEKREEFNRLDEADENVLIISRAKIEKKLEPKKEEIIKPRIEIVAAPSRSNNREGIPLNYVRLTEELNLPRADKYELSEVDHIFLSANENKFLFGGKKVMTVELIERCFVELEVMTGRDFSTLPKNLKARFKTFLEAQLDVMAKMERLDELVDLVYNRWRSRRDELKYPLLRQLWRPQADDTSHFLAFRPREKDKEKRNLRRINKANEEDARVHMEGLLREMEKSQGLVERVLARERWKLGLMNLDLQRFNIEARTFKDEPLFVKEVDKKQLTAMRETFQASKAEFDKQRESFKQEQQQQQQLETILETTSAVSEDTRASICNFLANLSSLASEMGIDWDTLNGLTAALPPPQNNRVVIPPLVAPVSSLGTLSAAELRQTPIVVIPPLINTSDLKFNVRRIQNKDETFIEKNFSLDYSENKQERLPYEENPYFSLRQRALCKNFYFEDDEEEVKDVRKSVAASFKKFLATKVEK